MGDRGLPGGKMDGWDHELCICVFSYLCYCVFVYLHIMGGAYVGDRWEDGRMGPRTVTKDGARKFQRGSSTGQGLTIKLEKSRINPRLGRMRSPGAVKVLFWSSPLTCRSRQLRPSFTIFVVKHRS